MKLIIYVWPDGAVSIANPNHQLEDGTLAPGTVFAAMMGSGGLIQPCQVAQEAANRAKTPNITDALALEYANAICCGGLTEANALDLLAREGLASFPGCTYKFYDKPDDEVWDRYFRDAWEWSD